MIKKQSLPRETAVEAGTSTVFFWGRFLPDQNRASEDTLKDAQVILAYVQEG